MLSVHDKPDAEEPQRDRPEGDRSYESHSVVPSDAQSPQQPSSQRPSPSQGPRDSSRRQVPSPRPHPEAGAPRGGASPYWPHPGRTGRGRGFAYGRGRGGMRPRRNSPAGPTTLFKVAEEPMEIDSKMSMLQKTIAEHEKLKAISTEACLVAPMSPELQPLSGLVFETAEGHQSVDWPAFQRQQARAELGLGDMPVASLEDGAEVTNAEASEESSEESLDRQRRILEILERRGSIKLVQSADSVRSDECSDTADDVSGPQPAMSDCDEEATAKFGAEDEMSADGMASISDTDHDTPPTPVKTSGVYDHDPIFATPPRSLLVHVERQVSIVRDVRLWVLATWRNFQYCGKRVVSVLPLNDAQDRKPPNGKLSASHESDEEMFLAEMQHWKQKGIITPMAVLKVLAVVSLLSFLVYSATDHLRMRLPASSSSERWSKSVDIDQLLSRARERQLAAKNSSVDGQYIDPSHPGELPPVGFDESSDSAITSSGLGHVHTEILKDVLENGKGWYRVHVQDYESKGAVCLDGSPGSYLFSPSLTNSKGWVVHLQGGGWCVDQEDSGGGFDSCQKRMKHPHGRGGLGDSPPEGRVDTEDAVLAKQIRAAVTTSVMSDAPKSNPAFYEWNKVIVWYCDGGMFSGQSGSHHGTQELPSSNGVNILNAVVDQLLNGGMNDASQIVLSGDSAGAAAVILQLDHMREQIPRHIPLVGFANAGLFLDVKAADDEDVARQAYAAVDKFHQLRLDASCSEENKDDLTKCFIPGEALKYVTTPLFVAQAAVDTWQTSNILQLSSLCQSSLKPQDKEGKKDLGSLTGCTAEDKTTIKASQDKLAASIEESLAMFPSNGAWVTPCLAHVLPVYNTEKQRKAQGQALYNTFVAWYAQQQLLQGIADPLPSPEKEVPATVIQMEGPEDNSEHCVTLH